MSISRIKNLESLTKTLLIIFSISIVSLVHKLDSFDLERDIDSLGLLKYANSQFYIRSIFENGNVYASALHWLTGNQKELGRKNADALREAESLLLKAGLTRYNIWHLKTSSDFGTKFSLIRFPDLATDKCQKMRLRQNDINQLTVKELLSGFEFFTQPRKMIVATRLDSSQFKKIDFSNRSEKFQFRRFFLDDDNMAVFFFGISDIDERYANAAPWDYESVILKADVVTFDGPSFSEILFAKHNEIEKLAQDNSQLTRLAEIYGRLQLSLAQSLTIEEFSRAFRSIDIFGLTFSTRRFAIGVMAFCFLTLTAIAWMVNQSSSVEIVPGQIQLPLYNVYFRFLAWVVLPQAAIYFSLPPYDLSMSENAFLYSGSFATLLLSIFSTYRARKF